MSDLKSIINSDKWHTTFYYEQELRSLYMNQVLSGLVKPGIYNANFSLVTIPNTTSGSSDLKGGLYVYIKKGSTFIFSNYYKKVSTNFLIDGNIDSKDVLERSFEYPGTVVIKCVAEDDMCIPLVLLDGTGSPTSAAKYLLGADVTSQDDNIVKKPYYIVAKYVYNPTENSGYTAPNFEAHVLRENFANIDINDSDYKGTDSYYFIPTDNSLTQEPYPLPDGATRYLGVGEDAAENVSYLILGKVNPINSNTFCSGTNGWKGNEMGYPTYVQYVKEHTFVSRGLPEFSNSQVWDQFHTEPHIIPSEDGKSVYLDLPPTQSDDVIVSAPGDWKEVHRIANYGDDTYGSSPKTLKIANFKLTPGTWKAKIDTYLSDIGITEYFPKGEYISGDGSYVDASHAAQDLYKKYKLAQYPIICDIVFLKLKKNISNIPNNGLLDIFSNTQDDSLTENDFVQYTWLAAPPYEVRSEQSLISLDPASDRESDRFFPKLILTNALEVSNATDVLNSIVHKGFSTSIDSLKGRFICPQDKCQANIDRLLPLITNNSFIPTIIDDMRKNRIIKDDDCTALVPMFVSFRKMFKTKDTNDIFDWYSVDGVSNFERVHPANILSFFDLQNSSTKINSFNIKSDNVFNILSVID